MRRSSSYNLLIPYQRVNWDTHLRQTTEALNERVSLSAGPCSFQSTHLM